MKHKPRHVAVIMDGNGRWASLQRKARTYGHRRGVIAAQSVIRAALRSGIAELTLFGFSSENRARPKREVEFLMWLFSDSLNDLSAFVENGVSLRFVGDLDYFGKRLRGRMRDAESETAGGRAMRMNIALNYGGRWDIAQAAMRAFDRSRAPKTAESVQSEIEKGLVVGDVDLLIRTGGEVRISNFLLWQCSYAELYFTKTLWPDFDERAFGRALTWFAQRRRRFGKTTGQLRIGTTGKRGGA